MSSRANAPAPGRGSSVRRPAPATAEDALSGPVPPTDDTPTIISRQITAAPIPVEDPSRSVRGRRLAHFELIEPIGVGGMAAVLRARDTQLDRIVALKILPPEMALDAENVRRFHQEARSAAKLDHENIARVFFCGEDQRLHFIAFEFVEGENLRTILERRGRLPVGEALHYMLQVAAGLAHAAQRGVVHRDIKPSNIIITPGGRAKLVDMGLARSLVRKGDDDLTQSGVTLGTFDYISPEQALEPRDADTRSDIYSLGCTFYHVLTGRVPVPEGTAAKKLHHHQHVKPADPRDIVPGLPAEAIQVLDRMMAKQPSARYQTPEQLVQALLAVARHLGIAHAPEGTGIAVDAPLPPSPAGRSLVWVGVAVLLIGLLVAFSDTGSGDKPRGESPALTGKPDGSKPPRPETKDIGKGVIEKPPAVAPVEAKPAVVTVAAGMTPAELARELARHKGAARLEIVLEADVDLTPDRGDESAPFGLLAEAKQITVRSRQAGAPRTIRLAYDGRVPKDGEEFAALRLACQRATVEDVVFRIDATEANIRLRALSLPIGGQQSGMQHTVSRCLFVQARPSVDGQPGALASLSLGERVEASLKECAFLGSGATGGQDAVLCAPSAKVKAEDCAFGPHATVVRMGEGSAASLLHCSALLPPRRAALFDMVGASAARLESSVVARQFGEGEGTVLLRQTGEGATFNGADNSLSCLDGYWAKGDDWKPASWTAFRKLLAESDKSKDDSRLLPASPWQETSLRQREALNREALKDAFAVSTSLRTLRKQGRSTTELLGTRQLLGASLQPATLPEADDPTKRKLVVEQGRHDDTKNGVYGSLASAVLAAQPGDTVLVRHDGLLAAQPMTLNRKELANLTIKAAHGFRPVLSLSETSEATAELFRVHDGRLRLEGLEFRLGGEAGGADEKRTLSVVALVGDGECVMKGCAVTLLKSEGAAVSVATLVAAAGVKVVGMPPARLRDQGPRLALEDCLVRGEGDLLSGRVSRPAGLELKNTIAALSGSLFFSDFEGGDMAPPTGQKMSLTLERVTAYLGGPLVRLKARKGAKGSVPVEFEAKSSVLLPANGARALVQLEAPEGDMDEIPFKWTANRNAYGAYSSLVAQASGEEMPMMMGAEKLKKAVSDSEGVFGAKLARPPEGKAALAEMGPGSFALAEKADAGAQLPDR